MEEVRFCPVESGIESPKCQEGKLLNWLKEEIRKLEESSNENQGITYQTKIFDLSDELLMTEKSDSLSSELEANYKKIAAVLLQNERELFKISEEFRNKAGTIRADALVGYLSFSAKLNRVAFEWVKSAIDAKEKHTNQSENEIQKTSKRIDDLLNEYGGHWAKWKNEAETIQKKIHNLPPKR